MNGLLDRIARGRKSVSRRIGLPSFNGGDPERHTNGGPPELAEAEASPAASADTVELAAIPAQPAAPKATEPTEPGFRERGRMRRRARYLRRLRELQLRDIGGFLLELHRFERRRPDLVQAKVAGAADTDRELRALERALDEHRPLCQIREAGIGGACSECGTVHGSEDRFCAWCGLPLTRDDERPDR